jgi:threonine-phosphate decarboxylase
MSAVHGGDLAAIARRYGVDAISLVDFSANIAPDGPPAGIAQVLSAFAARPRSLAPYPDPSCTLLRLRIGELRGVEPDAVVVGRGSAALIDVALRASAAPEWLLPVPAFSEYRRALSTLNLRERTFTLPRNLALDVEPYIEALSACPQSGALITTPHNPSGRALHAADVQALLTACELLQRPLIVDEAFIDYVPDRSIVREAARSRRAIALQSLTKFYALAGVRIGYAIAHPDTARRMRELDVSWSVGTLDEALALAALADAAYAERTLQANARHRAALARELSMLGADALPSDANFLLVELPIAPTEMDDALAGLVREGVVVRDCRSFDGLERRTVIRVAVLDRARNALLVRAISRVIRR